MDEPREGPFQGCTHVFAVRIYYEDTDAAGVVYYANYLKFAERARTEMMRDLGFEHPAVLDAEGVAFAVRWCHVDYAAPARLDDLIEVHTQLLEVRGASMDTHQVIKRGGENLVVVKLRVACLTTDWRPAPIPQDLRKAFTDFSNGNARFRLWTTT